jgi:hypothetical protein
MKTRVVFQVTLFGLFLLVVLSVMSAFAAGIEIQPKNVGVSSVPVRANDLKPPACSSLDLTYIVRGTGFIAGTEGNDLILGGSAADTVDGRGGNDCILAAGGDDTLIGGDGNDVCLGGTGADLFDGCETEVD